LLGAAVSCSIGAWVRAPVVRRRGDPVGDGRKRDLEAPLTANANEKFRMLALDSRNIVPQ